MGWGDILGQERVIHALKQALRSGHVGQAYLFHGPAGSGKTPLALTFAQALQCRAEGERPCDVCPACRRARQLIHPDIHLFFPTPSDVREEDIQARRQLLVEEPYAEIDYAHRPSVMETSRGTERQAFYSVTLIQEEVRKQVSLRAYEGPYKVLILLDIDRMRVEAANAFLKILEEPTPDTVFLLTTARLDRVLPTVLSRCQQFRLDMLEAPLIARALQEREKLPEDMARVIGRMANGSYSRALEMARNEHLHGRRDMVVQWMREAYRGHTERLMDLVEELATLGREQLVEFLQLQLHWLRDVILFRETGSTELIMNIDQAAVIQRFSERVTRARLEDMIAYLEEAVVLIRRNIQPRLVLLVLAHRMHHALHGRAFPWPVQRY